LDRIKKTAGSHNAGAAVSAQCQQSRLVAGNKVIGISDLADCQKEVIRRIAGSLYERQSMHDLGV
jgi:hypothetical protein